MDAAEIDVLERALAIVARDLPSASELDGLKIAIRPDSYPMRAFIELDDGWSCGEGFHSAHGMSVDSVLEEVAEQMQEVVMERMWRVWPVCDEHRTGVHVESDGARAAWRCRAGDGHTIAAVGALLRAGRTRGRRR